MTTNASTVAVYQVHHIEYKSYKLYSLNHTKLYGTICMRKHEGSTKFVLFSFCTCTSLPGTFVLVSNNLYQSRYNLYRYNCTRSRRYKVRIRNDCKYRWGRGRRVTGGPRTRYQCRVGTATTLGTASLAPYTFSTGIVAGCVQCL